MRPDELATTAVVVVAQYLKKGGDALTTGPGAELWELMKRPFSSPVEYDMINRFRVRHTLPRIRDELIGRLSFKLEQDKGYAEEVTTAVDKAEPGAKAIYEETKAEKGT